MMSMTASYPLLISLLAAGLLLIGGEIFVPGGIVGTLGVIALLGAIVIAFNISPALGWYVTVAVVALVALTVYLWVKLFPKSSVGRKLTLSVDGRAFKSSDSMADLLGQSGVAQSDLRPAGFALFGNRKIDVVTEGGLIPKGERVRVLKVEGNRVVVRKAD